MIITIVAIGVLLSIGILIFIFGGRPKDVPSLHDIMINPSAVPDARPYYASRFRRGGIALTNASRGKTSAARDATKVEKQSVMAKVTDYISEGLKTGNKAKDLTVMGRTVTEHAQQKLYATFGVSAIAVAFYFIFATGTGGSINPVITVILLIAGGFIGYVLPDSILKSNAAKLRTEFNEAFYSWLDIVSQYLTTGEEAGSAMIKAAGLSQTWTFKLLYSALSTAQLRTLPVYQGLDALAKDRGLDNLYSLRDTLKLSTDHGVELGDTLRSYIQAYRSQNVIDAEAKVKSFGEQSSLPLGMVVIAFVILIAYPGVSGLLGSFGVDENTNIDNLGSIAETDVGG